MLDEHQDVQSSEEHGVHVQEIDCNDPGSLGAQELPVLCQNSFIGADLAFRARYAALRYSLIRPPRTSLRSIRAVISMALPG
jgi:hypothetical protein